AGEFLLHASEEFVYAPGVEHIFEPRFGPVGAVAVVDEHPYHRICHDRCLGWLHDHAGRPGEIPVTGDAADSEPKPHARLDPEALPHGDGGEADVVGVLQHRNDAAAVEAHVELARDAVESAIVENVKMPIARVGPRVDELLRIDPGGRCTGHIADVVGTRTARTKADVLDVLDKCNRILGRH